MWVGHKGEVKDNHQVSGQSNSVDAGAIYEQGERGEKRETTLWGNEGAKNFAWEKSSLLCP